MSSGPRTAIGLCGGFVRGGNMSSTLYELSPRLEMVAGLAAGARCLADVGCDHGLLSIWLLEHAGAERAIASDVRPGPLAAARRNAAGRGLGGRIRFELCDGLDFPGADEADTVVIAGMGGETMAGILSRAQWTKRGAVLVLQPQSKLDELCLWLAGSGYRLETARLAAEGRRLYPAMRVIGGAASEVYAEDALLRGKDPLLGEWLEQRLQRAHRALAGVEQGRDRARDEALRAEIGRLEEIKGRMRF